MDAIFMSVKVKPYQMLQKIPTENSKAICLIHEQKLLMILIMAVVVKLEAVLKQPLPQIHQSSSTEAKFYHK